MFGIFWAPCQNWLGGDILAMFAEKVFAGALNWQRGGTWW